MGNDERPNYITSHWFSLFVNKSVNGFQIKNVFDSLVECLLSEKEIVGSNLYSTILK